MFLSWIGEMVSASTVQTLFYCLSAGERDLFEPSLEFDFEIRRVDAEAVWTFLLSYLQPGHVPKCDSPSGSPRV